MGPAGVDEKELSAVYDAAVDDDAWRRLPSVLRQALDAESAVLFIENAGGERQVLADNLPTDRVISYGVNTGRLNPWAQSALAHRMTDAVMIGTDLVSEQSLRDSEFYADFGRTFGTGQAVGGVFTISKSILLGVSAHRPLTGRRFSQRQRDRAAALLPHVRQVVRLRSKLRALDKAPAGWEAFEALAFGVVICDRGGRVCFANTAAEALATERKPWCSAESQAV